VFFRPEYVSPCHTVLSAALEGVPVSEVSAFPAPSKTRLLQKRTASGRACARPWHTYGGMPPTAPWSSPACTEPAGSLDPVDPLSARDEWGSAPTGPLQVFCSWTEKGTFWYSSVTYFSSRAYLFSQSSNMNHTFAASASVLTPCVHDQQSRRDPRDTLSRDMLWYLDEPPAVRNPIPHLLVLVLPLSCIRNHLSNTTCLTHVLFKAAINEANDDDP
jgi:hypothetical protein